MDALNSCENLKLEATSFLTNTVINGRVALLTPLENETYWQSYPKEAQIRFYAYAPTSSQPIISKDILEQKRIAIQQEYSEKTLPLSPYYCGFRVIPEQFIFYHFRADVLSDLVEYTWDKNLWRKQLLSP